MKKRCSRELILFLAWVLSLSIIAGTSSAAEKSGEELVKEGNRFYEAGDQEKAEEAYREALKILPGSSEIYFNLGNAAYRRENFQEAEKSFSQALNNLKGQAVLEKKILYNLGNTAYRMGMKLLEADLEKALEALQRAALYYREVVERDRRARIRSGKEVQGDPDAPYNLEVVRLRIKEILDRIKKEEEKKEKPALLAILERVIDTQRSIRNAAIRLSEGKADPGEREKLLSDAISVQSDNLDETGRAIDLLEEQIKNLKEAVQTQQPQPGKPPLQEDGTSHLVAAKEKIAAGKLKEESAYEDLKEGNLKGSVESSREALQELVQGLSIVEPLSGLGKRVEIVLDEEEIIAERTASLQEEEDRVKDAIADQGKNLQRTDEVLKHLDAISMSLMNLQEGGQAPQISGDQGRLEKGLNEVQNDILLGKGAEEISVNRLEKREYSQALDAQKEAIEHFRNALKKIRDLNKTWVQYLAEAAEKQKEVIFETETAASLLEEKKDASGELNRSLEGQKEAIEGTALALQGLESFIQNMMAQIAMEQKAEGAGRPLEAPPVFKEIRDLIEKALLDEKTAAVDLEKGDGREALEEEKKALQKLEEALKKVQELQKNQQDQTPQPKTQSGQQQEKDEEGKKREREEQKKMTPEEAKRKMEEKRAEAERMKKERERELRKLGYRESRTEKIPVEKDW